MRTILKPKLMGLALVAVLGTTACATAGQAGPGAPSPRQAPKAGQTSQASQRAKIFVNVTNDNLNDVDVYALTGGLYQRLTFVPSMDSVKVKLPSYADMTGTVRLLVAPIGGQYSFFTGEILVSPGDDIRLTVSNPLDLTNWFVS